MEFICGLTALTSSMIEQMCLTHWVMACGVPEIVTALSVESGSMSPATWTWAPVVLTLPEKSETTCTSLLQRARSYPRKTEMLFQASANNNEHILTCIKQLWAKLQRVCWHSKRLTQIFHSDCVLILLQTLQDGSVGLFYAKQPKKKKNLTNIEAEKIIKFACGVFDTWGHLMSKHQEIFCSYLRAEKQLVDGEVQEEKGSYLSDLFDLWASFSNQWATLTPWENQPQCHRWLACHVAVWHCGGNILRARLRNMSIFSVQSVLCECEFALGVLQTSFACHVGFFLPPQTSAQSWRKLWRDPLSALWWWLFSLEKIPLICWYGHHSGNKTSQAFSFDLL